MTFAAVGRLLVAVPIMLDCASALAQNAFLGKMISAKFEIEISLYNGNTLIKHGIMPVEANVFVDANGHIYNYEGGKRGDMATLGRVSKNHLWTMSGSTLSSVSVSAAGNNTVSFSAEGDQCSVGASVTNKQGYNVKAQTRTSYCRLDSPQAEQ